MENNRFAVPSDLEFLEAFGVEPAPIEGDEDAQEIRLPVGENDSLVISYDVGGQSFRVEWQQGGVLLLSLFREGAERLLVRTEHGETHLAVKFGMSSLTGEVDIRVYPSVSVCDRLLFT
jgi:hypothetical protein